MTPRHPASVEIYSSGPPARERIDIALLESEQASSFSEDDSPELIAGLRAKAAQMGCDAVIIGGLTSRDPGLGDAEMYIVENPRGRKGIYGTCVVYPKPRPKPGPTITQH